MNQRQAVTYACSGELLEGLVGIAMVALTERFPDVRVDLDEIETLLDAVRALRPAYAEIGFFDGLVQAAGKRWSEAAQTFRGLIARSLCLPQSRGLMLYALNMSGDSEWQHEAGALRGDDDARVALMALSLLASEDLARAADVASRTGKLEMPASLAEHDAACERLRSCTPQPGAAEASATPAAAPWLGYGLRI